MLQWGKELCQTLLLHNSVDSEQKKIPTPLALNFFCVPYSSGFPRSLLTAHYTLSSHLDLNHLSHNNDSNNHHYKTRAEHIVS